MNKNNIKTIKAFLDHFDCNYILSETKDKIYIRRNDRKLSYTYSDKINLYDLYEMFDIHSYKKLHTDYEEYLRSNNIEFVDCWEIDKFGEFLEYLFNKFEHDPDKRMPNK